MANRWWILFVLFFVRTTMAVQFQAVSALSPLVLSEFAASLADLGLMIGLYSAPGIVLALPGGALAARFGEVRMTVVGIVLMAVGGMIMATATTWEAAIAGRVIAGSGGVLINVLMSKMLTDWFIGREIATAMAIFINSWPIGIAAALVVLPYGAELWGLGGTWAAVSVLIVVGLALFLAGYRAPPMVTTRAPVSGFSGLPYAPLFLAASIWALFNCALAMVFGFGPALLSARGWSLAEAGTTTSLCMWLTAISVPLGGYLADRTGRPDAVLAIGLAGSAIFLIAAVAAPGWAVPSVFVALGIFGGLPAGPSMSMPARVLSAENRGTGMGLFFTIYYTGFLVFSPLAGWISDLAGTLSASFLMGAALLALCLAAQLAFRRITAGTTTA